MDQAIDDVLRALAHSRFRCKFSLGAREQEYIRRKGVRTIFRHARDFIARRLAPAHPHNDGKQTPMKGHPVFIAQHATATCCRRCLAKWHRIPQGRPLSAAEQRYVPGVIWAWARQSPECR